MTFDYAALEAAGITRVVIEYNGAGDEGWIDSITAEPDPDAIEYRTELYDTLKRQAYDLLEEHHGGWEINEGSTGTITLDVPFQRCRLNHGERYENVRWSQQEFVG